MSSKAVITISIFVFGTIGGYVPIILFGVDGFSMSSIIGNLIGGFIGIYIGYRISHDYL